MQKLSPEDGVNIASTNTEQSATSFQNPSSLSNAKETNEPNGQSLTKNSNQQSEERTPLPGLKINKSTSDSTTMGTFLETKSPFERSQSLDTGFLPGEVTLQECLAHLELLQFKNMDSIECHLVITNYKFSFKPINAKAFERPDLNKQYFQVPLATSSTTVEIFTKDGRIFRFWLLLKQLDKLYQLLQTLAAPEKIENFFAFDFFKNFSDLEQTYDGWKTYDIISEFKRQGLPAESLKGSKTSEPAGYKYKFIDNRNGNYCSTYPAYFVIPNKIKDEVMKKTMLFRSRERLPVVTYYHASNGSCLYRSAQSKPGISSNRCIEDEIFLQYLGNPDLKESSLTTTGGGSEINLLIVDARPYLYALANRMNGKGFEDVKNYKNCELEFMQIDNIHGIRDSHKKLMNLCLNPDLNSSNKWFSQLESTGWLEMISLILSAGTKTAQVLLKGRNVLVHCSDGWDRTAQICSIAQILLDPYYRTIEGFEVLIEKDWISFGYQSQLRLGLGSAKDKEDQRSPIIQQFLDCVHQLVHQFPFAFQYNTKFLQDISYYSYTCQFGTFLANNYQEIKYTNLANRTVSLWSFINSNIKQYFNGFYECISVEKQPMLTPKTQLRSMRLWEEYYLCYSSIVRPPFKSELAINFPSDFAIAAFNEERKKVIELEAKLSQVLSKIEHMETEKTNNGQSLSLAFTTEKQNEIEKPLVDGESDLSPEK